MHRLDLLCWAIFSLFDHLMGGFAEDKLGFCFSALLEEPRGDQLRLHSSRHGAKALVLNSGLTAVRVDPHKDFNFAIVRSDRPLYDNEIFEVVVEEMEGRWSGKWTNGHLTHIQSFVTLKLFIGCAIKSAIISGLFLSQRVSGSWCDVHST